LVWILVFDLAEPLSEHLEWSWRNKYAEISSQC
jgi:hypothetical protein